MLLAADTEAKFQHINLNLVAAIGTYDDSNGKYYTLNFSITGGQDIVWKYDNKERRDSKLAEAQNLMNSK